MLLSRRTGTNISARAGLMTPTAPEGTNWASGDDPRASRVEGPMGGGGLHDQIARLESDIEELAEITERCRKIILASKIAIAAGGIVVLAIAFGAIRFDAVAMLGGFAAVFGGAAVFGSNTSTLNQTTASMKVAELQRSELISRLDLRVLGDS